MTNAAIAKFVLATLLRLLPACFTTVEVGNVWDSRPRPSHWEESDNALAAKVIGWRSSDYPRARVIAVVCVKR